MDLSVSLYSNNELKNQIPEKDNGLLYAKEDKSQINSTETEHNKTINGSTKIKEEFIIGYENEEELRK